MIGEDMKTNDQAADCVQFAGFSKRLNAFAFDYLVILGYIVVLTAVTLGTVWALAKIGLPVSWPDDPLIGDLIAFLTLVLPVVLYFASQECSVQMGTCGKRKVGLKVPDGRSKRLTFKRALARSLLKFLPWQLAHTSLFHIDGWPLAPQDPSLTAYLGFALVWVVVIGYIASTLLSKDHRAIYDRVVGAQVIVTHSE